MRRLITRTAAGAAILAGSLAAAAPAPAQETTPCYYYEDFSDGIADRMGGAAPAWRVADEVYRLVPRSWRPRVFTSWFDTELAEFRISVDVRLARGNRVSRRRGMGVVFFSDGTYRNCMVFHINARGKYIVFERVNGVTRVLTEGWQQSPELDPGVGAWNRLHVSYNNDGMLEIYVNNDEGTLFAMDVGTGRTGYAGLKGFGNLRARQIFEFDDLGIDDYACWDNW